MCEKWHTIQRRGGSESYAPMSHMGADIQKTLREPTQTGRSPVGQKHVLLINVLHSGVNRGRGHEATRFITLLGCAAAALPLGARAQQVPTPVIGYLSALSETQAASQLAAFRRGLNEAGFVEGQNVAIEFRWANGQYDRLPAMATELVRRPVTLVVAQTPPAALAAKGATTNIPIVFVVGFDPVAGGLVTNLARPGGNITGLSLQQTDVAGKRLGLLRELASMSSIIAVLINPNSPNAAPEIEDMHTAAQAIGVQLKIFNASTLDELNAAFVTIARQRPDALLVGSDPFFVNQRAELVALAL